MEKTALPTLKPLLVETVSDDIRDIRKGDNAAQKTLLSGLAIKDVFASDTVDKDVNETDSEYFTLDEKIDLDKITAPGCRNIPPTLAVNGPKYAVEDLVVNGRTTKVVVGGFLYTFNVLGNGVLQWAKSTSDADYAERGVANGGFSYKSADEQSPVVRREEGLDADSPIRQVFWCHFTDHGNTDSYTRIGHYNKTTDSYEWGDWALLSGEMMYIVVTDPAQEEVVNPLPNAIYSVHCTISNFILPETTNLKYGTKIVILQYPDIDDADRGAWFTRVTYTSVDEENEENSEEFSQLCTPVPNRNTFRRDKAYLEDLSPATYTFEVVPKLNSEQAVVGKTWELLVDADETEFLVGLTEMLGAHTDPGVNEIVDYLNLKYSEESTAYSKSSRSTLVLNRSMPCTGYVNGTIVKNSALLKDGWTVVVKAIATNTDGNFVEVADTSGRPSQNVLYFTRRAITESGVMRYIYEMAVDPGGQLEVGYLDHRSNFPAGKKYYTINSSAYATEICRVTAKDLAVGQAVKFNTYLNRHNVLYVSIQPDNRQTHLDVRNGMYGDVRIGIVPDPHRGAYISKERLNPSAYTQFQMDKLVERGQICMDLVNPDGKWPSASDTPVSSQAVFNAYAALATTLQKRGLLNGLIDLGSLDSASLDQLTETGCYKALPLDPSAGSATNYLVIPDANNASGWPEGATVQEYANITVLGSRVADPTMIDDDLEYIRTYAVAPDPSETYYTWDQVTCTFVLAENDGHPDAFNNAVGPYYVKTVVNYILTPDRSVIDDKEYYLFNTSTNTYEITHLTPGAEIYQPNNRIYEAIAVGYRDVGEVTQMITQNSGGMQIWFRSKNTTKNGGAWSQWIRCFKSEYFTSRESASNTNLLASDILNIFASGEPVVDVGGNSLVATTTTVNLPEAYRVARGRELVLNFTGSFTDSVLKVVTPNTTSASPALKLNAVSDKVIVVTCKSAGTYWLLKSEEWLKKS